MTIGKDIKKARSFGKSGTSGFPSSSVDETTYNKFKRYLDELGLHCQVHKFLKDDVVLLTDFEGGGGPTQLFIIPNKKFREVSTMSIDTKSDEDMSKLQNALGHYIVWEGEY